MIASASIRRSSWCDVFSSRSCRRCPGPSGGRAARPRSAAPAPVTPASTSDGQMRAPVSSAHTVLTHSVGSERHTFGKERSQTTVTATKYACTQTNLTWVLLALDAATITLNHLHTDNRPWKEHHRQATDHQISQNLKTTDWPAFSESG